MGYSSNAIVEILPTIQCEVPTGWPVILVRLRGCNCHCEWCDTKYSWIGKSRTGYLTDEDIEAVLEVQRQYPCINTLLVTGGEPLLYINQRNFLELLNLEQFHFVQIETNGSLITDKVLEQCHNFVHHVMFHISPKLDKSFYKNEEDYENLILRLSNLHDYCENEDGYWSADYLLKFVYSPTTEDVIKDFILKCDFLTNGTIHVMSKTPDINAFEDKNQFLAELRTRDFETIKFCMKYNYRFVPRFHMMQFLGDKTEMTDK